MCNSDAASLTMRHVQYDLVSGTYALTVWTGSDRTEYITVLGLKSAAPVLVTVVLAPGECCDIEEVKDGEGQ